MNTPTGKTPADGAEEQAASTATLAAGLSRFAMAYVAGAWGMAYVAVKYLLTHGWSGEQVAYLRIIVPGLLLAPLAVQAVWAHRGRSEMRKLPWIMLLGVFGFGVSHYVTVMGQRGATAAVAGLLSVASPLTALILAAILRIDKLTWRKIAGALLSVLGVAIVVLYGRGPVELSFSNLLSPLLIILGFVLVGVYNNLIKPMQKLFTPLEVSAVTASAPALLALIPGLQALRSVPWGAEGTASISLAAGRAASAAAVSGAQEAAGSVVWNALFPGTLAGSSAGSIDPGILLAVLWLGVFAGGLAIFSVGYAVSRIGPASASAFLFLNPVVSILGGYLLLGETLTAWLLLGAVLIISGLLLANRKG